MLGDAVSPIPPTGWEPPPFLADVGWHPRELAWLAASLHDRVQRLQVENRALRGLPPSTDEQNPQMTFPTEFHVSNPIHRERMLREGDTLCVRPAIIPIPNGEPIPGAVVLDAAGQPRLLLTTPAAWRIADEILAATLHEPEGEEVD